MIECFFDDSGKESDANHRFVCIAGYLAHDQFWYGFTQRWRHLLLKHGIPAVHMREWEGVRKAHHWSLDYGHRILGEFIALIREFSLIGFGMAVDAEVWRKLSPERRKSFGDAQEFCFQRIIRRVVDRMEKAGEREPLAIVFDQDFQFARPRLRLMEHIHKRDRRLAEQLSAISFADSRRYYQLQAADILAWETRRHLVNRSGAQAETEGWKELFAALPDGELDYEGEFWDAEMVETEFAKVEADWKKMQEIAKLRAS